MQNVSEIIQFFGQLSLFPMNVFSIIYLMNFVKHFPKSEEIEEIKEEKEEEEDVVFDKTSMVTNTVAAMKKRLKSIEKEPTGTDISQLETRLNLLK